MLLRDRCSSAGEIEESHMSSSIVTGTSFSFPFLDGLLAVLPEAFLRLCCPEAGLKSHCYQQTAYMRYSLAVHNRMSVFAFCSAIASILMHEITANG